MAYFENRSLLKSDRLHAKPQDIPSTSSDEWSSSYSSDSSVSRSYSDESYVPDWESHVNKYGNLFYLEYNTQTTQTMQNVQLEANRNTLTAMRNGFDRTSTRRSKKTDSNRLSKLISRHDKLHKATKKGPSAPSMGSVLSSGVMASNSMQNTSSLTTDRDNKVKFNEMVEGEMKEIVIYIDPAARHKFGRRTSVSEALLGFSTCPFPNSQRIMIAGYMPNAEICHEKAIKIGDWLKSINDQDVTVDNFDFILLSFVQPTNIRLQLKRIAVEEQANAHQLSLVKVTNTGEFVTALRDLVPVIAEDKLLSGHSTAFTILYLSMNSSDEASADGSEVIFCYPPKEVNCLYGMRGMFLTLNSLFRECTFSSRPTTTNVTIKDTEYYVAYHCTNDELLLIALSSKYATFQETKLKMVEIVRYLEMVNKTLPLSFPFHQRQYHQHSSPETNFNLVDLFSIQTHRYLATPSHIKFEETLIESHYIPLPKEIQLRIDDALGEMEAMDFREWNDSPLSSHREFYILGSAIFYRKYLLASHLPPNDLLDVETFLRTNGIYLLLDNKSVRDMVVWREIFPKSVERGLVQNDNIYGFPKGRWFLTVVARNQMSMAVILESRHTANTATQPCSASASAADDEVIGPSTFYIEEITDTLDHLRSGGVENLAHTWLQCNKRPEILKEIIRDDFRLAAANAHLSSPVAASHLGIKKTEIISILKRRHNSMENVGVGGIAGGDLKMHNISSMNGAGSSSINSTTLSDGSLQKFDDDDDESDSDWDGFPDSQRSSSGFDMSDMTGILLKDVTDVIPSKITAGEHNMLFHYVEVEVGDGILLSPTTIQSAGQIIPAFRKACLLIHSVLQNTIRFRYILSQEATKPNSHRSLVAIKEHGVLISTVNDADEQIEFWAIGRLFSLPPKEVYVCHRADVPQNLVEIAFRLVLNCAG